MTDKTMSLVKQFNKSFKLILKNYYQDKINIDKKVRPNKKEKYHTLGSFIHFESDGKKYEYGLFGSELCLKRLYSLFMEEAFNPDAVMNPDAPQILSELCNMIYGDAKKELNDKGWELPLAITTEKNWQDYEAQGLKAPYKIVKEMAFETNTEKVMAYFHRIS